MYALVVKFLHEIDL